jgi:amino acid transporter
LLTTLSAILGYVGIASRWKDYSTIVIGLVALNPFVVMCIIGAFQVNPGRWLELPLKEFAEANCDAYDGFFPALTAGNIIWRPFLNNLFWNLNSFDHAAHFAGHIQDVGKTFPRAMLLAVVMVVTTYVIPLMIAIGATDSSQEDWYDGYMSQAAKEIGGVWLGSCVVFAAAVSNIAMFQAELSKKSLLVSGLAERNFLPKVFENKSVHGTPTYAIVILVAVSSIMGIATFATLIEIMNFNYSIALLMEFGAFIKLRISYPNSKYQVHDE